MNSEETQEQGTAVKDQETQGPVDQETAEQGTVGPMGPRTAEQGAVASPSTAIQMSSALGEVFVLPEEEQIQLLTLEYEIEQSLKKGWTAFVEIGEALIKIREQELYRAHGGHFEDYCAGRWGFRHSHANQLMGAARFVKSLESVPTAPKPERESIVRPLLKLTTENAHRVWMRAAELANGRDITARLVRAVVREQNPDHATQAELRQNRAQSVSRRARITEGFGELMRLVAQRADYSLLTQKLEALYTQCQCLLTAPGKNGRRR